MTRAERTLSAPAASLLSCASMAFALSAPFSDGAVMATPSDETSSRYASSDTPFGAAFTAPFRSVTFPSAASGTASGRYWMLCGTGTSLS